MPAVIRACLLGLSALAATAPAAAEGLRTERNLSLELANQLASAAVAACAAGGHAVSVTVVDRGGAVKAVQRADDAPIASLDASRRKAYTAASFRLPSVTVMESMQKTPGAQNLWQIEGVIGLAGGQPVKGGGETVGGIGVAGSPAGHLDDQCALSALKKFAEELR